MKNLYKYEINESIAAKAAMNCLKNRNNPKKLNETSEFDARFEFRKDLRELAFPAAKKAYMIIRKQYGDGMWRRLYMDDCDEQGLIDMLNMYAERGLKPQQIVNKMMGVQEQEEHPEDYDRLQSQLADAWDEFTEWNPQNVPYNNTFDETHNDIVDTLLRAFDHYFNTEDDVNGFWQYYHTQAQIGKAVEEILDKYGDFPTSNDFNKCYAWVKKHAEELIKILERRYRVNTYEEHPEFDFSEQEENVYSDVLNKIINDGLDYWDVWAMAKQGKATKTELEISSVLLELFETLMYNGDGQILSKVASGEIDKRELKRIIVDILMEQDADTFPRGESEYNSWVNEHNSEIVKRLEEKFNEEQEEIPQMERRDMILALTQYLDESWIDASEDGDLNELYYAVAEVLDRTGDYPASTDWEDCKPWCQKHYREVEETFLGGGF